MNITYTPGPQVSKPMKWDANESMIFVADNSKSWVAHITHNGERMPIIQDVNARIMAAAPELLVVAQAVLAQADTNAKPELLAIAKKAVEACYG